MRTSIPVASVKPASGAAARTMGSGLAETTTGRSPAAVHAARSSCAARTRRGGTQERANRSASAATSASSRPACSWAAYMYPMRLSRSTARSYSAYGLLPPCKRTQPSVTRWRRNASPTSSRQSVPSASNAATPPSRAASRTASRSVSGITSFGAAVLQGALHRQRIAFPAGLRAHQAAAAVPAEDVGRRGAHALVVGGLQQRLEGRRELRGRHYSRRAEHGGEPHVERLRRGLAERQQPRSPGGRPDGGQADDRLRAPGGQERPILRHPFQDRGAVRTQRAPLVRRDARIDGAHEGIDAFADLAVVERLLRGLDRGRRRAARGRQCAKERREQDGRHAGLLTGPRGWSGSPGPDARSGWSSGSG